MELGRQLAPLRNEGVLIIGSGNIVHNLGAVDFGRAETGFDWAQRFDQSAREVLQTNPSNVSSLDSHRDFDLAVPTPDHYLPMLYVAGLANEEPLDLHVNGHARGLDLDGRLHTGNSQHPVRGGDFPPGSDFPDIPITECN